MQALQRAAAPVHGTSTRAVSHHVSLPCRPAAVGRPVPFTSVTVPARQQQPWRAPSRSVACQGLFGLGLPEIAVIAGIAALVFGPSKLPELGKGLGKTIKSFQTAAKEFETELKQASSDGEQPAAGGAPAAPAAPEAKKEAAKKE